jgi:hypothetical protein
MLLGELLTLRQQRLPVKVVVLNNGALAFVELEMKADGIVNYGTDLDNPSFAEVARAVGLHGVRIEHPSELDDGLRAAFAHDGPAVIEVMTERQELSIPPKITAQQARGSRCGRPAASSPGAETRSSRSPRPTSASSPSNDPATASTSHPQAIQEIATVSTTAATESEHHHPPQPTVLDGLEEITRPLERPLPRPARPSRSSQTRSTAPPRRPPSSLSGPAARSPPASAAPASSGCCATATARRSCCAPTWTRSR